MSREWDRAARDRLASTRSLGSRCTARTELTAAIKAVSRAAEAEPLSVSRRAEAFGAATTTNRTAARTDSAPRNIRSAVFYQAGRTVASNKRHEDLRNARFERGKRWEPNRLGRRSTPRRAECEAAVAPG